MLRSVRAPLVLLSSCPVVCALVVGAGCGHQTQVYTDVAGAQVTLGEDSAPQGEALDDPWGGPQTVPVRVSAPTGELRFEVERKEVALTPVLCGATGGATVALAGCGGAATSVALASVAPGAAGCAVLALPALLVGAGAAFACPGLAYWLWGRQGPDEINVSFEERRILVSPDAEVTRVRWLPSPAQQERAMAH